MSSPASLQVRRRRRVGRAGLGAALVLAVAGVLAWYTAHPPALPTSADTRRASTPVDDPVYVGMFSAPGDFGRTLGIDGVKVRATADTEVDLLPLLCRGGSVVVTSDPGAFCRELVDPQGQRLGAGDSLVVEVSSREPAVVVVDRLRVGYQDGIRADTQEAGVDHAVVTVLGR